MALQLARSQQNSNNRLNQKFTRRAGRCSYASSAAKEAFQYRGISLVDSWGNRHKKGEVWQSDIARQAFEEMKASTEEMTQRMIQQAEEEGNTLSQPFQLPFDAQIPIMAKHLGHRGKEVRGVGYVPSFPGVCSSHSSGSVSSSTCGMVTRHEFDNMKAAMSRVVDFMMAHMTLVPGFDVNSMMQLVQTATGGQPQPQPQEPPHSPTGSNDVSTDNL